MTFDELDEFRKDLKKLLKKYRSLNDDLETDKSGESVPPYYKSLNLIPIIKPSSGGRDFPSISG
jgi:hypothetical protein